MDMMSGNVACGCVVLGTLVSVLVFGVMRLDLLIMLESFFDHLCMSARVLNAHSHDRLVLVNIVCW